MLPEIPNLQLARKHARDNETLEHLVHEVLLQQLDFLGKGEIVLDARLPGAAVIGFTHVAAGRLVA